METIDLRPLSLGELLDRTFSLYKKHFWLFVGIMAIPSAFMIPANILILSFQGSFMNISPGRPPVLPAPGYIAGVILGYLAFMVVFLESSTRLRLGPPPAPWRMLTSGGRRRCAGPMREFAGNSGS